MAYLTFMDGDIGLPILSPVLEPFMPGAGALAPWVIQGQTNHKQPYLPSAIVGTSTVLNAVPIKHSFAVSESKADGNYRTFHNRGNRGRVSPPTK